MWKIFKDLSCFSLLSFLKRIAKKVLGSFKRRTKSMINTTVSSESLFKENQKLTRNLSCPEISANQTTQDLSNVDEDINTQEVKSISKSKKKRNRKRKNRNKQNMKTITSTPKEEDENKELSSKVKSSISTALTIGLIGAKAASFFFAIKSLMSEENTEDIDIDV